LPGRKLFCPEHFHSFIDIDPRRIGLEAFGRLLLPLFVDLPCLKHYASPYHNFPMAASRNPAQPLNHVWLPAKRTVAASGRTASVPF